MLQRYAKKRNYRTEQCKKDTHEKPTTTGAETMHKDAHANKEYEKMWLPKKPRTENTTTNSASLYDEIGEIERQTRRLCQTKDDLQKEQKKKMRRRKAAL